MTDQEVKELNGKIDAIAVEIQSLRLIVEHMALRGATTTGTDGKMISIFTNPFTHTIPDNRR